MVVGNGFTMLLPPWSHPPCPHPAWRAQYSGIAAHGQYSTLPQHPSRTALVKRLAGIACTAPWHQVRPECSASFEDRRVGADADVCPILGSLHERRPLCLELHSSKNSRIVITELRWRVCPDMGGFHTRSTQLPSQRSATIPQQPVHIVGEVHPSGGMQSLCMRVNRSMYPGD